MIKINLLTVERKAVKKKVAFEAGQKLTIGCSIILIATAVTVGWRYWSLGRESSQLDADITAAQKEQVRLTSVLGQVQQFEQRKAQLQQRVLLIEQLRKEQTGPVHMLDEISRALPPMLWLSTLKQSEAATEVVITGKCTNLTVLTDFVSNLEKSGFFKKSIEIINTQQEPTATPPGELVAFTVRAQFQPPVEEKAPGTPGAPGAKGSAPAAASAKQG